MNQPTQELKKELLPSLKKGLQRIAAQEDPVFKFAMRLKERDASLTDEEAYSEAERILSEEGIPRVRTEDDDEEAKAWKAVTMATVAKVFGVLPQAVEIFEKEYDSQIKDVTQPQGGTEKLTNVRSPGQPPAKIPAEPGRSGRNGSGSYRTSDDQVNPNPKSGRDSYPSAAGAERYTTRSTGGSGENVARTQTGYSNPYHQQEGTNVYPSKDGFTSNPMIEVRGVSGNYGVGSRITSHAGPSDSDARAFGSATDRREAEQVMGKAFTQALDQADANGSHSMAFDLRRAGMGTVKEVDPNLVASIPIIRKEFDRLAKSGPESTDTAANESEFDYAHFRKAFELEKQASGMRRLAADQELAGNYAARDDLRYKALLLDREAAEIRKQVHTSSLQHTLRTVLSKPVK